MKLVTTWFGSFITDEEDRVTEKMLFPAEAGEIARRLEIVDGGGVLPEEESLARGRSVTVRERRLAELGDLLEFSQPEVDPAEFGFGHELLGAAMLRLGRDRVRAKASPDEHVVQAIRAVDDMTKIVNLMSERLHEWHSLNFPELAKLVPDAKYAELIAEFGDRKSMLASGKVSFPDSIGGEASEADAAAMRSLAKTMLEVSQMKRDTENYIELRMKEIAPNTAHVAGALIGARLISLTGGLDRLSKVPASTIQLLGAEKALFKHIKERAKPPKHGVIFQHPLVHRSPQWQRGKIARALAAKISIAVKMDRYGREFIGPKLEADLNRRVEDIRRRCPKPNAGHQKHR